MPSQTQLDIAVILEKISNIEGDIKKINEKLEKEYVTVEAFGPVKSIVYGLVSLILVAVVGALIALVIRK